MNNQTPTSQDLATQALDEAEQSDQFAETLQSLENIIERKANKLEDIRKDLRNSREMLKNYFDNDAQLAEVQEQADEYRSQVKVRKTTLNQEPQVVDLKVKVKELNETQKEMQEALSNHLVNHHRMTNSTSFDTSDGDQWEYMISAKVKSKPKNK